jgi:branched-chain amino acid transport system substrate-binding protein
MTTRPIFWIPTILFAGALLAGCNNGSGGSDEPLGIAVLGPFSGPSQSVGNEIRNTVQMAAEEQPTVAGREVKPVFVDSMSDPEMAPQNYREAVQKPENDIVVGNFNWHSDVSVTVMDAAADMNLAHVAALGATGMVNEKFSSDPERYNVWSKGWPDPVKLSANYVTAIEDAIEAGSWSPGEKKVAIYGAESAWGQSFGNGIKSQLEANGWTVVGTWWLQQDGQDFTQELMEMSAENPTLLAGTFATEAILPFIQQAKREFSDAQEQPLIVADGLGWQSGWYDTLGEDSNFVIDQIPQFATSEAQAFATQYENQWGEAPSPSSAGLAYDYFRFCLKVLERTKEKHGEITRETVRMVHANEVLEGELTMDDGILMQQYIWTADSRPDPKVGGDAFTFPVLQYMGGDSQVVWPEALSSGDANLTGPTSN